MKNRAARRFLTPIDTPLSISLAEHLTPEEREELLLTVETLKMFTEANPDNDQSLEILKDTYWKLGQQAEALAATRKLADAYLRQGQFSAAMLEYEGILVHQPDSAEIQTLIADLDARLNPGKTAAEQAAIALDFGDDTVAVETDADAALAETATPAETEPALIATPATRMASAAPKAPSAAAAQNANEPLSRFVIQHRLASREAVQAAMERVKNLHAAIEANPGKQAVAPGLLDELIKDGADAETLMSAIVSLTKYAYAPLDHYDVDRQIVRMLPECLTLGRRVVPFDIVSRTMMVALDNPFDAALKTQIQQAVDYHVQWHLALPGTLHRILRESYRLQE